jgi:hypothetical protein
LRFALQPFECNPVAGWIELLHLNRDVSTEPRIMGGPDLAHPASADRPIQPIAARQQPPCIHATILLEAQSGSARVRYSTPDRHSPKEKRRKG